MGKRRGDPRRHDTLPAFKVDIAAMTLDELNALRVDIGREHADQIMAANLSRRKLDTIKAVMFERKHGGAIGISDHAVLRYLQRHKGIDVRSVREEIQELIARKKHIEGTDGHFEADGGVTLVIPQDSVVATVL